jgi:hypothetical protein
MAQASKMTFRRAALYVGGASLLVAWFSSAASLSFRSPGPQVLHVEHPVALTDGLAGRLQVQRQLLRQRLAAAPVPQQPVRNPFAFRPRAVRSAPPPPVERTPVAAAPLSPPEPVLTLIGVAERTRDAGAERTAMIATEAGQLILARVGDLVLQRYKVTAIGADAAELSDVATGGVRRIALQ